MRRTRTLKLTWWHLGVWLALAATAASLAHWTCREYNTVAGTDKTPGHMAIISAAVMCGPMIGPVANSGAGVQFERQAFWLTLILMAGQIASLCPFLLVRRPVSWPVLALCWLAFIGISAVYFFAALVSLALFLS